MLREPRKKKMIYFQSFYDALHCSRWALVSMHTVTANWDVTVAEIQRTAQITPVTITTARRSLRDKGVSSETTHTG